MSECQKTKKLQQLFHENKHGISCIEIYACRQVRSLFKMLQKKEIFLATAGQKQTYAMMFEICQ